MASSLPLLLQVEHLSMKFGGLTAIEDLSFNAYDRQITAIIGPNGAGKTTLFNCLTGFYKPTCGRLTLFHNATKQTYLLERMEGFEITKIAKVSRTFQNIRLFPKMTALENLLIAQHNKLMKASGYTFLGLLGFPSYAKAEKRAIEKAKHWLEQTDLIQFADWEAGNLPYGAQRRLEIARSLCTDPVLLCLDEPAAGLNPKESAELGVLLQKLRDEYKIGLLLIEHDMSVVMEISDHVIVIDYGKKISDGTPEFVKNDPAVLKAYLGEEETDALPEAVVQDIAKRSKSNKVV